MDCSGSEVDGMVCGVATLRGEQEPNTLFDLLWFWASLEIIQGKALRDLDDEDDGEDKATTEAEEESIRAIIGISLSLF